MPKAAVYTLSAHGGVGMKHLFTKQCLQKVIHILMHLRTETTLRTLLKIAIKAHLIKAGVSEPILENIVNLSWMSD